MRGLELQPCLPPVWARGGHAQTIWGHLLPSPPFDARGERLEIPLPDGDRLTALRFTGRTDVVVCVFHGLGGDTTADYMARTARLALRKGHGVYLVNHRGCGQGEGLARRPYHSGRGEDVSAVVEALRVLEPRKRILAVGFSLSGNALLCLLTGLRGTALPDYAIAVNAPIDLAAAAQRLSSGMNRIYDLRFVARLRDSVRRQHAKGLLDRAYRLPWWMTVREFDELFTAPESGFASRDEYYSTCSTQPHLHRIGIPTILLTAEDDPFVPFEAYRTAKLSPSTILHAERTGGHMGYLTRVRTPLGDYRWLDYALDEAIAHLIR